MQNQIKPIRRAPLFAAPLLAVLLTALLPAAPAQAQAGRPLAASLSGGGDAALGDVDGSGAAWLTLNQGQERICFELSVRGTAPVSNVRLVEAGSGRSLLLLQNGAGPAARCVEADKELVKAVRRQPEGYQVVVGTSQYPQGALRGALANPTSAQMLERIGRGGELPDKLAAVDWSQVNWESIDWEGIDWDNLDLDAIDWSQINLEAVDWQNIDPRAVVMRELEGRGVDWRELEIDWENIDWDSIDWDSIDWESIDWERIDWRNLDLDDIDWSRLERRNGGRNRRGGDDDD